MVNATSRSQRQYLYEISGQYHYEISGMNSMEKKSRPPGCGGRPKNFLTLNFPLGIWELVFGFLVISRATQKNVNRISSI
jgi:hypothetical protein